MKTMFSKNSCDGYIPSRIFLNSLNHMSQWSSLKLIRSSVESFSLFGCSFVHMKRVIPRSVLWPDCFPEQRRFSFTENMPSSSMDSSLPGGWHLEPPKERLNSQSKPLLPHFKCIKNVWNLQNFNHLEFYGFAFFSNLSLWMSWN